MKTIIHKSDVPRGGARTGAGRPALPDSKRRDNFTVKGLAATRAGLIKLAKHGKTSQGSIVEWFVLSPSAAPAREQAILEAREFDGAQPGRIAKR